MRRAGREVSGGTFAATEAVELAVLERSGFVESRHIGSAVVVSPSGEVVRTLGNPDAPIFPRSCLKPFQALAVLNSGVELNAVQTVLATASHAATPEHVAVVESILAKAGLTTDALQCPDDWPGDSAARDELVRGHQHRASIYMNCSGKHAAMLLACVVNGWPIDTYLDLDHPLQQRIVETIESLTGERIAATGTDGCGAPVHAISLTGLARGIGRITGASAESVPAASVLTASVLTASVLTASVLANGWAIDGPGRANTLCIDSLAVFSKLGAEGVMVMSTTPATPLPDASAADGAAASGAAAGAPAAGSGAPATESPAGTTAGTTVAIKMLDGSLRAATLVGLTLLVQAGALDERAVDALLPALDLTVYGGTSPVGSIRLGAAVPVAAIS
ncbi:asparaginase [Subtercola vilae]|uniref:Asparaginase n=1 Tax=Subtercola vilae TaxID=2056433 RepID=A0A4T2BM57_9MICO|nr:asparaginase [Subtercola vilae]